MEIKQLKVLLQKSFVIGLDLNSGTGFKWHVNSDENFVKLLDERTNSPSNKPGSTYLCEFEFYTLQEGKTLLEFMLKRTWEQTPTQKIIYELEILSSP